MTIEFLINFSCKFHSQADDEFFSASNCSASIRTISLGYRHTNEHICQLVVEILMELSSRCVENPEQWQPEVLMSLALRLTCMKSYLGGSEFLLKGFAKILQTRDERFKSES